MPSTAVALNRAVAWSRVDGVDAGLALLDALAAREGERVGGYQPYHAARAALLRRAGRHAEAAASYRSAIALTEGAPERGYLEARLAEVEAARAR